VGLGGTNRARARPGPGGHPAVDAAVHLELGGIGARLFEGHHPDYANPDEIVAVPNRLRELRDARGLTRREFSIDLDVTEATVFRWESSRQAIPDERKIDLARYFGVPVSDLMGWPRDKPPKPRRPTGAERRSGARRSP
jgi:DNA-binding XRE family transcriptional regulator